jgi:hypothetical protein
MKNINIKKYLSFLLVSGLMFGCFPDEDELTHPYRTGTTIPVITEVNSSFFDSFDFDNAFIEFTVDVDEDIAESVTIEMTYEGQTTELGTYTEFPAVVRVSASEAVAGLSNVNLNDLEIGDMFRFEVIVNSANGLSSRSNVLLNAAVACRSDLAGTYSASTSGQSTDGGPPPSVNPISNYAHQVTLTETDVNGVYTISDFSGGLYNLWYAMYGATGNFPGTIQDVCNSVSFINTTEPFGTAVTGSGSVDPETGVITLSGTNGYGDTWTMVLTPAP